MYGGLIKKSWKEIFHHLDLFLPDVFSVVLTFILALIALAMSGIHPGALTSLANSSPDPLTLFNFINDVFIPNSLKIFLGVVFFIVTTFFFGTSLLVTKYKMFKDLLQNKKKVSFFQSFIPANEHYYWRILGLKILVFLIFFFVFLILSLLALVFALASPLLAVILLLLLFPTSFYFGSVYTESLFLALVVWSFYFARWGSLLPTSLLGALASGTRIIGIILLPIFLIETFMKEKKLSLKHWPLILIPAGLLIYMYFLFKVYGDPLAFIHSLPSFGEQRSATPIILPQVFYRYIFKILPNLNYDYFPVVFTTLLEFGTGLIFFALSIIGFFKFRLSYAVFLFLGYIIPTLSGSFSSLPRYVIVLFPAFILISIWIQNKSAASKFLIYSLLFVGLVISTAMFVRGYWIS